MKHFLRTVGFELMLIRPINVALRTIVRPFRRWLPWGVVHSIPMVGEIDLDLPDGRRVVLTSDGYDSLASRVYWSGIDGFEPESLKLFLELLETSETVLDVGSHVGLYALLAAVDRPDTKVLAFEPVPRNLGYLRTNVDRNRAANIEVVDAAVGDHVGEIVLHIPDTTRLPATASIHETGHADDELVPTPVRILSLDSRAATGDLGSVDLVKLDVEGAELDALRGAAELLAAHRPAVLCEILHGFADSEGVTELFRQLGGYRFFLVTDDGLIEHEALTGDPTYFYKNYLVISDDDIEPRLSTPIRALEDQS